MFPMFYALARPQSRKFLFMGPHGCRLEDVLMPRALGVFFWDTRQNYRGFGLLCDAIVVASRRSFAEGMQEARAVLASPPAGPITPEKRFAARKPRRGKAEVSAEPRRVPVRMRQWPAADKQRALTARPPRRQEKAAREPRPVN